MFRHKKTISQVRKTTLLYIENQFWSTQTWLEMSRGFPKNTWSWHYIHGCRWLDVQSNSFPSSPLKWRQAKKCCLSFSCGHPFSSLAFTWQSQSLNTWCEHDMACSTQMSVRYVAYATPDLRNLLTLYQIAYARHYVYLLIYGSTILF